MRAPKSAVDGTVSSACAYRTVSGKSGFGKRICSPKSPPRRARLIIIGSGGCRNGQVEEKDVRKREVGESTRMHR